jgi:hypothetical protein
VLILSAFTDGAWRPMGKFPPNGMCSSGESNHAPEDRFEVQTLNFAPDTVSMVTF